MPQQVLPENQSDIDFTPYKPLFDQLTAYVPRCSGYRFVGAQGALICAEFKYPGGKFPLALDPQQPIPYNVNLIASVVKLHLWMDTIPGIDLSKVR